MIDADFVACFLEEAEEILEKWESICLELEGNTSQELLDDLFRAAHNIKGSSKSVDLEAYGAAVHIIEDLITIVKDKGGKVESQTLDLLLESQQFLVNWNEKLKQEVTYVEDFTSLEAKIAAECARLTGSAGAAPTVEVAAPPESVDAPVEEANPDVAEKDIGVILFEEGAVNADQLEEAARQQNRKFGEILVDNGVVGQKQVDHALEKQQEIRKKTKARPDETIRISRNKLDELLQVIGELSIHQSVVQHCHKNHEYLSNKFVSSIELCDKIIKSLHGHAFSLRMQPLKGLFQRLERVGRDTAKSVGKNINLVTAGDDAELDKFVIERILDPLVHIIRNAIDHGLETNEERTAAGKGEQGQILLSAEQHGAGVSIIVKDGGRGIDPDRILQKGIEKGLVKKGQNLSKKEILELILAPGFSTAENVTNISGRGVGMDVVRTSVEELSGTIDIESDLGQGTMFKITLPTSLSIIEALIIELGQEKYAVPIGDLSEVINLHEYEIKTSTSKGKMFNLRGDVIPVEHLAEFLVIKGASQEHKSHVALIANSDGGKIAITVDKILGQQPVVVRKLEGNMETYKGVSGTTILGSGEPGLIVDLPKISEFYFQRCS